MFKMHKAATILIILLLLASTFAVVAFAQQVPVEKVRIIIGLKDHRDIAKLMSICVSCMKLSEILEIRAVVIEVPKHIVDKIKRLPFVEYVEEDKEVRAFQEVQWNVKMIYAVDVWTTYGPTYGSAAYGYYPTIRIAVLDTGIDYKHSDLQGAVSYCIVSLNNGATFYRGTDLSKCADQNGHGTHVAGIIAARLNGFGVAGVAPKAVLYAVKVLGASGGGYISDIAKGIVEAVKGPDGVAGTSDDADIISMSLGGPDSQTLYNAVKYAYSYGVVLVAAAGNEGASSPSCPACYPEVIAVGAIDQNYNVPSWSNRNPDVVAPGVNILSTYPGSRYAYMSGTSMACPHVSAVVALIQALRLAAGLRKLTPDEVRWVLVSTAIDLGSKGYDSLYGYGLVDAYATVQRALSI